MNNLNERELEKLVMDNQGLVVNIAKKYKRIELEFDDLMQLGNIGLMKAIRNFDESRGFKFSTYAVPMIQGEIRLFLRDNHMRKTSRIIYENNLKMLRYLGSKKEESGWIPEEEISEATGLTIEEVRECGDAFRSMHSLDMVFEEGNKFQDVLVVEDNEEISYEMLHVIRDLPELEAQAIEMHFVYRMSQDEIAKKLGTNQVRISRALKRGLEKLKNKLAPIYK